MSRILAAYLIGSLLLTVVVEVALYGPSGWTRGLLVWAACGFLAHLLYGEQKAHPAALFVPLLTLLALLYLKALTYG